MVKDNIEQHYILCFSITGEQKHFNDMILSLQHCQTKDQEWNESFIFPLKNDSQDININDQY